MSRPNSTTQPNLRRASRATIESNLEKNYLDGSFLTVDRESIDSQIYADIFDRPEDVNSIPINVIYGDRSLIKKMKEDHLDRLIDSFYQETSLDDNPAFIETFKIQHCFSLISSYLDRLIENRGQLDAKRILKLGR